MGPLYGNPQLVWLARLGRAEVDEVTQSTDWVLPRGNTELHPPTEFRKKWVCYAGSPKRHGVASNRSGWNCPPCFPDVPWGEHRTALGCTVQAEVGHCAGSWHWVLSGEGEWSKFTDLGHCFCGLYCDYGTGARLLRVWDLWRSPWILRVVSWKTLGTLCIV